jgi:putative intracellular protease/amidase
VPPAWPDVTKVLLVIPHENFWYPDYAEVIAALESHPGVKYRVASSTVNGPATPNPTSNSTEPVKIDFPLRDVTAYPFDAVIFLGANPPRGIEFLSGNPDYGLAKGIIDGMLEQKKCVAGICAGMAVLADADVLRGKSAPANQYAISAAGSDDGVHWDDRRTVIVSGNLVTARDPQDAPAMVDAMLRIINKQP